jgi:hypothetical protein
MGYLDDAEPPEPVPVFMYDGAAGRANVGEEVTFVLPSERFKDGAQLKVFGVSFSWSVLRDVFSRTRRMCRSRPVMKCNRDGL